MSDYVTLASTGDMSGHGPTEPLCFKANYCTKIWRICGLYRIERVQMYVVSGLCRKVVFTGVSNKKYTEKMVL